MMTLPSRSRMCALISPACSLTRTSRSRAPERIRARVSRTHVGHNESVVRGHPSAGEVRSQLFDSGAGAHEGWKVPLGTGRLRVWNTCHAAFARCDAAVSSCRANMYQRSPQWWRHYTLRLLGARRERLERSPVDLAEIGR